MAINAEVGKTAPDSDGFDFSDEGESPLDIPPILEIQVGGRKGVGKTTGVRKLFGPDELVAFISFDGETGPIKAKMALEANGGYRTIVKNGARYLYDPPKKAGLSPTLVSDRKMTAAASKCVKYILAMLEPSRWEERPVAVVFDATEYLVKICENAARAEYRSKNYPKGFGLYEETGKENFSFWEMRNNHLRRIRQAALQLATKAFAFTTKYEYEGKKKTEPELKVIPGDWADKADVQFEAFLKLPALRKDGEAVEGEHYFRVVSCKRDDQLAPTGTWWDMHTDDLRGRFEAYDRLITGGDS